MRVNLLGILFTVLSGVLIFLTVFAYGRSDRTPPEFRFSSVDLVYGTETTDNDLMVGINAYDSKDGDVSDRIVVEKVVLNREKETAVVYYAAADLSGNVIKQSRVFPADIKELEKSGELIDSETEAQLQEPVENTQTEAQPEQQNPLAAGGEAQQTNGEAPLANTGDNRGN